MQGDQNVSCSGVTKHVYLETLKKHLLIIMDDLSIILHDNAPIHKAKIIQEWFYEAAIDVVTWPPYSPNLILLENLWKMLKG